MAYARFGDDSDVYLYQTEGGLFVCCACRLVDKSGGWYLVRTMPTIAEALEHLQEHRNAGHAVPQYSFDALRADTGD